MSGNMLMGGMPQANPLLGPGSASPPQSGPQPSAQNGAPDHAVMRQRITQSMRGMDQDTLIRRRDTAGKEMQFLQGEMTNPDANVQEIEKYIGSLVRAGQFTPSEAVAIMRTLPRTGNPAEVRNWAQLMFAAVAHVSTHAHSAFPVSEFPGQAQQAPQQAAAQEDDGDDNDDADDGEEAAA